MYDIVYDGIPHLPQLSYHLLLFLPIHLLSSLIGLLVFLWTQQAYVHLALPFTWNSHPGHCSWNKYFTPLAFCLSLLYFFTITVHHHTKHYVYLILEHGFELLKSIYTQFFSVVNTTVLHDLRLVESSDVYRGTDSYTPALLRSQPY